MTKDIARVTLSVLHALCTLLQTMRRCKLASKNPFLYLLEWEITIRVLRRHFQYKCHFCSLSFSELVCKNRPSSISPLLHSTSLWSPRLSVRLFFSSRILSSFGFLSVKVNRLWAAFLLLNNFESSGTSVELFLLHYYITLAFVWFRSSFWSMCCMRKNKWKSQSNSTSSVPNIPKILLLHHAPSQSVWRVKYHSW